MKFLQCRIRKHPVCIILIVFRFIKAGTDAVIEQKQFQNVTNVTGRTSSQNRYLFFQKCLLCILKQFPLQCLFLFQDPFRIKRIFQFFHCFIFPFYSSYLNIL